MGFSTVPCNEFVEVLGSKAPVPGGGGASALVGAVGTALGCMMEYMRYTPRTLTELLDANPMPEIFRVRKDGSAVEVSK